MKYNKRYKAPIELIDHLKRKGIKFKSEYKNSEGKLNHINYYKLKEYASKFYDINTNKYKDLYFNELIDIYYLDKELRANLLHAIEKIEISFKVQLINVLGTNGAFNYLEFKNWINKEKYNKQTTEKYEMKFKEKIIKISKTRESNLMNEYFNKYDEKYPPIWILIEILTLGEVLWLYNLMIPSKKKKVAKVYGLKVEQLESWLLRLKLVRNLCAHNMKIYDIKFYKKIKVKNDWNKIGVEYNKIASVILILYELIDKINRNYDQKTLTVMKEFLEKYPNLINTFGLKEMESIEKLNNIKFGF